MGFLHGENGIVPIGEDGFPIYGETPELEDRAVRTELDRYAIVDIEPVAVTATEMP
ncbi:hypothetical protein AB0N05_20910 [Nocardia sp. NPDC051030]|uniref:hypothetical protein n=1 Tax=Nocardia sp. NPDC051030 TaxID=3155162 RepID=UPI003441E8CB